MLSYGQFKNTVNNTYPEGRNIFSCNNFKLLIKSDEELNKMLVESYEEEYYENEDGDPERRFYVDLVEA